MRRLALLPLLLACSSPQPPPDPPPPAPTPPRQVATPPPDPVVRDLPPKEIPGPPPGPEGKTDVAPVDFDDPPRDPAQQRRIDALLAQLDRERTSAAAPDAYQTWSAPLPKPDEDTWDDASLGELLAQLDVELEVSAGVQLPPVADATSLAETRTQIHHARRRIRALIQQIRHRRREALDALRGTYNEESGGLAAEREELYRRARGVVVGPNQAYVNRPDPDALAALDQRRARLDRVYEEERGDLEGAGAELEAAGLDELDRLGSLELTLRRPE